MPSRQEPKNRNATDSGPDDSWFQTLVLTIVAEIQPGIVPKEAGGCLLFDLDEKDLGTARILAGRSVSEHLTLGSRNIVMAWDPSPLPFSLWLPESSSYFDLRFGYCSRLSDAFSLEIRKRLLQHGCEVHELFTPKVHGVRWRAKDVFLGSMHRMAVLLRYADQTLSALILSRIVSRCQKIRCFSALLDHVQISQGKKSDMARVAELYRRTLGVDPKKTADAWFSRNRPSDFLVASREGSVIGFSLICFQARDNLFRHHLAASFRTIVVSYPERNKGLGSELLRLSVVKVRACGAQRVYVSPEADNFAAIRLFEKAGFRILNQNRHKVTYVLDFQT